MQNTRPITLLDTARKFMTKIMYRRLSQILRDHKVLTGGNFAGLPGDSVDPPIATLEALLSDARYHQKPLFIFQQDISKAFDSIDPNMLRLAMARLAIPRSFIDLTLQLFTNRYNTIITAFGHTSPYKVQIGIDQGEVISPLLWVIYIDPLLTALNASNTAPYVIDTDPTLPPVTTSTLGYMDDTNLIASSTDGIINMLQVAQEFYDMNNTKINFSKAVFVCNRDPTHNCKLLPRDPIPFTFPIGSSPFTLTPIKESDSFRFLGVWFSLSTRSTFVK